MGSEIISVVERRRHWPLEDKLKIVMEALEPGASMAAVADRHGIARGLLYTWLRLVREGRMLGLSLKPEPATGFAPVHVEAAPAAPAPMPTPPALPARRRASLIEVKLPNGRVVKVDEGIDPAALAAIIAALDSSAP